MCSQVLVVTRPSFSLHVNDPMLQRIKFVLRRERNLVTGVSRFNGLVMNKQTHPPEVVVCHKPIKL